MVFSSKWNVLCFQYSVHLTSGAQTKMFCIFLQVVEYSLYGRKYTAFSRGLESRHPIQWLLRGFAVNNVTFDPNNENIIMLQDDNTICVINKNKVCLYCL
jgi:hypothetical protein